MLRRLLALALAALLLAVAGGCADDVSPALRVGDEKLGNDEFLAEVAEWAGNPAAVDAALLADQSPGTYPLELVRQLLQQRIDFVIHNQQFERLDLDLDDQMRDEALTVLFGDPSVAEEAFSEFTPAFASQFIDDVARQVAVSETLGDDEYSVWRNDAYATLDIEVNPRYGTWDRKAGQVVAPVGPTTTAAPVGS